MDPMLALRVRAVEHAAALFQLPGDRGDTARLIAKVIIEAVLKEGPMPQSVASLWTRAFFGVAGAVLEGPTMPEIKRALETLPLDEVQMIIRFAGARAPRADHDAEVLAVARWRLMESEDSAFHLVALQLPSIGDFYVQRALGLH